MARRNIASLLSAIALLFFSAASARATLIGVSSTTAFGGTTIEESVVQSTDNLDGNGTYSGADDIFYLLSVTTDHVISQDLATEHDGSSGNDIQDGSSIAGTLPEGTRVNAYLFRQDQFDDAGSGQTVEMSVTFDNIILGLNGGQTSGSNPAEGIAHPTYVAEFNTVGATTDGSLGGVFDFTSSDNPELFTWREKINETIA